MSEKLSIYEEITDKIVEALEGGVNPWVKPWNAQAGFHRNAISNRPYRGVNILLLNLISMIKGYADPRWITFKAALENGGCVRKGERGVQVVFWKFLQVKDKEKKQEEINEAIVFDDADETAGKKKRVIPFARYYTVFNVEQCEGLSISPLEAPEEFDPDATNPLAEQVLTAPVIKHGGSSAAYMPGLDMIMLPLRGAFNTLNEYYVTGYHETAHWTSHESRLNRKLGKRFGDQAYAFEELVAEIAAAYLGAYTNVPFDGMQHPEYVQNWLTVLKGDKMAIFTAAGQAQKACDFVLAKAGINLMPASEAQEEAAV